jgi:hypothetical protein
MAKIPSRTFVDVALLVTAFAIVGCGSESATLGNADGGGSSDGTVDTFMQSSGGGASSSSGASSSGGTGSSGSDTGAGIGSDAASGDGGTTGDGPGGSSGDAQGAGEGGSATTDASPFQPDAAPGSCLNLGAACFQPSDCCSATCTNGSCQFPGCQSTGATCAGNVECCSGKCGGLDSGTSGACVALNPSCRTVGEACAQNAQCCSNFCPASGVCATPSFCQQNGDACQSGTECCGGVCTIPSGQLYGTCGQPPSGASNCSMVDGTVCGGVFTGGTIPSCGGSCCSRLCAPYGPTGVLICQPASGCHVVGDLCSQDADCCGSAALPGPGWGNVTRDFSGGGSLGVCRNPTGCKPNGDVCKLKTMSCNASCDCCSGNCETMDTCRQDNVGVPRCTRASCVSAGQACSTSADCCGGLPCVPNSGDAGPKFICYMGGSCVPSCGKCTINADCCVGQTCDVAQGSTSGVCGPCNPAPDGGLPVDGGTLPDAGIPPDGGLLADGGTPPDGSSPPDGAAPPDSGGQGDSGTCALYGQQCSMNSDCCNGIPCTSQRCISP